jgi:hypothetical protein
VPSVRFTTARKAKQQVFVPNQDTFSFSRSTFVKMMFKVAVGCTLLAIVSAGQFDEIVSAVNSNPNSTWRAEAPDRFGSFADVRMVCGTW